MQIKAFIIICLKFIALPENDISDNFPANLDLTKYCYLCGQYISFSLLQTHYNYHTALKVCLEF